MGYLLVLATLLLNILSAIGRPTGSLSTKSPSVTVGPCVVGTSEQSFLRNEACGGELVTLQTLKDTVLRRAEEEDTTYEGCQNRADFVLSWGAGQFDWDTVDLNEVYVCANHLRDVMMNEPWHSKKPKITVNVQTNPRRKKIPKRTLPCAIDKTILGTVIEHGDDVAFTAWLNRDASQYLLENKGVFYPVGSPICEEHRTTINSLLQRRGSSFASEGSKFQPSEVSMETDESDADSQATEFQEGENNIESPRDGKNGRAAAVCRLAATLGTPVERMRKPWNELADSTKTRKMSQLKSFYQAEAKALSMDNKDDVFKHMLQKYSGGKAQTCDKSPGLDRLLKNLASAFNSATKPAVKHQILSLVAGDIPTKTQHEYLPNLSQYYITAAKKHKIKWGTGVLAKVWKIRRRRQRHRVEAFINYITSSIIVTQLPFGWKQAKKSDGTVVEFPDVLRLMTAKNIILQYEKYLFENALLRDYGLGHTTYRKILKVCKASQRYSAYGIDYIAKEALDGFDDLEEIVKKYLNGANDLQSPMIYNT